MLNFTFYIQIQDIFIVLCVVILINLLLSFLCQIILIIRTDYRFINFSTYCLNTRIISDPLYFINFNYFSLWFCKLVQISILWMGWNFNFLIFLLINILLFVRIHFWSKIMSTIVCILFKAWRKITKVNFKVLVLDNFLFFRTRNILFMILN